MCPICGYDKLRHPPNNFVICPSCGTEFGYSDSVSTAEQLRLAWLLNGAHWHSNVIPAPPNWNPKEQLAKLNQRLVNTGTLFTTGEVTFAGKSVPPDKARISSRRIVLFGSIADLASYVRPVHA